MTFARTRTMLAAVAVYAVAMICADGALAQADECLVDEPTDYRTHDYLAPVTCTLRGARVLSTEALARLADETDIVLIDVLPSPRRPQGLAPDAIWLPKERRNIPGSVWLPNVGFGVLPVEEARYLRFHLQRLSEGDKSRPMVFYCLNDCWMSWNAALRALRWGYTNVHWYPQGTDGWAMAGLPLAQSQPEPDEE